MDPQEDEEALPPDKEGEGDSSEHEEDSQEDEEALPPDKEGEGDSSEHQEEQLDVHMEPQ